MRVREVECILVGDERDANGFKVGNSVHRMPERASQPVNLPDEDAVNLSLPGRHEQLIQLRPAVARAGAYVNKLTDRRQIRATDAILAQLSLLD